MITTLFMLFLSFVEICSSLFSPQDGVDVPSAVGLSAPPSD